MSGASFDTLCKRTRYSGSRKARRAEQRVEALLRPFGRVVLDGMRADLQYRLAGPLAFAGRATTSASTKGEP